MRQRLYFWLGPLVAFLFGTFDPLGISEIAAAKMFGIICWMAIWWISEAVPIGVTSLLPILVFPLWNVMNAKDTASLYGDPIIFLFLGGFLVGQGLVKWELHIRMAQEVLKRVPQTPSGILAGIMITTFVISMWMSNTVTTIILLPIIVFFTNDQRSPGFSKALLIGLAYAASIGGMATLIGTPTNLIFMREYNRVFPGQTSITFASWITTALPLSFLFLVILWFILRHIWLKNVSTSISFDEAGHQRFSKPQLKMLGVFVGMIFLCITRVDLDFGFVKIPGWSQLLFGGDIQESMIILACGLSLFLIPTGKKGEFLLEWPEAGRKIPLEILFLFGGGFALSAGVQSSQLDQWIATQLKSVSQIPFPIFVIILTTLVCVISEIASNVACVQLLMPIILAMLPDFGEINPLKILIPVALASSLGFMLPIATAPNTLVFTTGHLQSKDMMKAGFWADLIGILLISGLAIIFL